MAFHTTHHAEARLNQRGIRHADLTLLLEAAEQVAPDAFVMTAAATDREISRRKREIQQLERLKGKTVILDGEQVITGYHAHPDRAKQLRRKGKAAA